MPKALEKAGSSRDRSNCRATSSDALTRRIFGRVCCPAGAVICSALGPEEANQDGHVPQPESRSRPGTSQRIRDFIMRTNSQSPVGNLTRTDWSARYSRRGFFVVMGNTHIHIHDLSQRYSLWAPTVTGAGAFCQCAAAEQAAPRDPTQQAELPPSIGKVVPVE